MVTGYGTIESAVACMRAGRLRLRPEALFPEPDRGHPRKAQSYRQLLEVNKLLTDDPEDDDSVLVGAARSWCACAS
jgi:hypothetical protein